METEKIKEETDKVKGFYGKECADFYSDIVDKDMQNPSITEPLMKMIRAFCNALWMARTSSGTTTDKGPALIVDVGCGVGHILPIIQKECIAVKTEKEEGKKDEKQSFFPPHIVGIDISTEMIEAAKKRLGKAEGIDLHLGDMFHLDPLIESKSALGMLNWCTIHHYHDPRIVKKVFEEADRVLTDDGGIFLLQFWSNEEKDSVFGSEEEGGVSMAYTEKTICELAASVSFEMKDKLKAKYEEFKLEYEFIIFQKVKK